MEKATTLMVTSSAFKQNGIIPNEYIHTNCGGKNKIPPLTWSTPPADTKSLAIICDDPDAPHGTWDHWIIFNIPPHITDINSSNLKEILSAGAVQGTNSWKEMSYGGPCPPEGHGDHHYHFKVFAVGIKLNLDKHATKAKLLNAMKGHILAQGELVGVFGR